MNKTNNKIRINIIGRKLNKILIKVVGMDIPITTSESYFERLTKDEKCLIVEDS